MLILNDFLGSQALKELILIGLENELIKVFK
jgi:hypothetical protein